MCLENLGTERFHERNLLEILPKGVSELRTESRIESACFSLFS